MVLLIGASSAFATTFVVPPDRDLIHRANAIVIATAMASYSRPGTDAAIETVTPMQIEETIKGRFGLTLEVVEPGGTYGGVSMLLAGVPQFEAGQRMLLFLASTGKDRWAVTELVLGKFTFTTDESGQRLLVRDEDEIVGWDPNLTPHVEGRRAADRFLQFVRTEAAGGAGAIDYSVPTMPLTTSTRKQPHATTSTTRSGIQPATTAGGFSATSYTMTVSGSMGARWTVFPSQVSWFTGTTTEPGAPNGGVTAAQLAIAAWDNDCPSNVNYAYAGADNGSHTQGLHAADGANTILFERDLSAWGVSPFSCSGSGYSGTLGIGGVTSASGTNTLGSETFVTTREGDVEMNRGIANCTILFNNGDFNSAVAHELGHSLGFRHSDQNRPGNAACSTDPSLECSSSAIMTAFVTGGLNATLAAWDQHAVGALYPGGSCGTCTPPSITSQPQSQSIPSGGSTSLTVAATGTTPLSYQWYYGTSPNTASPIAGATGTTIFVGGTQTYSYWVRVSNACGSANSVTATVSISGSCTPPSITSQPQSQTIQSGGSTSLSVTATGTGLSYQWYYGTSPNTASPIAGATGTTIFVGGTQTYSYWVRVSNACGTVNSVTATVSVSGSCTPPSITSQPQSQTIQSGGSTSLSVAATGSGLSYQWYYGTSPNTASPIAGATGTTIFVGGTQTYSYWVRVANACGTVNSVTATVTTR